jgi:hypothetical protein
MSDTVLRQRLIRVASQLPKGSAERRQVLALLMPDTLRSKVAANQETQDFVEWVVNTTPNPMTEAEVAKFLKNTLRMEIQPPKPPKPPGTARFAIGDRVKIKKDKHKDEATSGPYIEFNGKIGTVTAVVKNEQGAKYDDALVKLDSGPSEPVRFPLALKATGVGIGKYTPPYVIEGSVQVEMIYYRTEGAPVRDEQQLVVEQYMGRARQGERRSMNYYSGHLFGAALNKEGELYFSMNPQQRMSIDPEEGYEFRSFNPKTGKVLYIGRMKTDRPQGWDKELEKMRAAAGIPE